MPQASPRPSTTPRPHRRSPPPPAARSSCPAARSRPAPPAVSAAARPAARSRSRGSASTPGRCRSRAATHPTWPATTAAAGGTITVAGNARVSIGSIDAGGGDGANGGGAASGGAISVRSDGGSIATGRVTNMGGNTGGGSGANGGPVSLSAQINLTVGSTLDTSGANATGNANPARVGGNAGRIYLRAATGTWRSAAPSAPAAASALRAPPPAPSAARAAPVPRSTSWRTRSARSSRSSAMAATAAATGTRQGPGGPGGSIFSWSDGTLFDDQKVVEADGGDGQRPGAPGARTSEMSPTAVAIDPAKNTAELHLAQPRRRRLRDRPWPRRPVPDDRRHDHVDRADRRSTRPSACRPRSASSPPRASSTGPRIPAPAVAYLKPPVGDPGLHAGAEVQGEQDGAQVLAQERCATLHWNLTLKVTSDGIGQRGRDPQRQGQEGQEDLDQGAGHIQAGDAHQAGQCPPQAAASGGGPQAGQLHAEGGVDRA